MINLNDKIPGCKNFIWKEVFASYTADRLGINNVTQDKNILDNLEYVMREVQNLRDFFGCPIRINSGYRCPELNKAVGGSSSSFHAHGMAVDLSFPAGQSVPLDHLFVAIETRSPYTELIAEDISPTGGWIHFALARGRENERQIKYKLVGKPVVRADFIAVMKEAFGMEV